MVDVKIEDFTAEQAKELGLVDAIKRGEVKITGTYEIKQDGEFCVDQNNFVFTDKFGKLRAGKFETNTDVIFFQNYFPDVKDKMWSIVLLLNWIIQKTRENE